MFGAYPFGGGYWGQGPTLTPDVQIGYAPFVSEFFIVEAVDRAFAVQPVERVFYAQPIGRLATVDPRSTE